MLALVGLKPPTLLKFFSREASASATINPKSFDCTENHGVCPQPLGIRPRLNVGFLQGFGR